MTKPDTSAPAALPASPDALRQRVGQLLDALCGGLYEREEAVRLAFLTAVAGESIFLLGPPGVGKSLIARRLKFAFREGTSFEYLMSKFSTPDEIFGPVSIKKLKDEDKYERLTERYMPSANVVFLDEIWKAGPAIQNALLTILNERIYRNGAEDMRVAIRAIISASNELPGMQPGLAPIWDRFLLRLELRKIQQMSHFVKMIVDTDDVYRDPVPDDLKLGEAELAAWSAAIDAVALPAEVLNVLQLCLYRIEQHNAKPNHADRQILVYDRRWKKIVRLLRASAFLNGRAEVDLMDCFLMLHCLWSSPEQRDTLQDIVADAVRQHGYALAVNLQSLKNEVADFEDDVRRETQVAHVVSEAQLMPIQEEYYALIKNDSQFKGSHIGIQQFRQLGHADYAVTNFFDEEFKLVNRLKARKGEGEHQIEVLFNDTALSFALRTQLRERSELIYRKPHRLVEQYWEERLQHLQHYIRQQLERLDSEAHPALKGLEANLFVEARWAELVRHNMAEVRSALQGLLLRLDKLRYAYAAG